MAAIYVPAQLRTVVMTTTLYPVEITDSIVLGVAFNSGAMNILPHSEASIDYGATDGSYTQLRWFYSAGPFGDDEVSINYGAIDGTYIQLRWFYSDGPYDTDNVSVNYGATDGSYINKLVVADTPDEELQLNCTINDNCSMEII